MVSLKKLSDCIKIYDTISVHKAEVICLQEHVPYSSISLFNVDDLYKYITHQSHRTPACYMPKGTVMMCLDVQNVCGINVHAFIHDSDLVYVSNLNNYCFSVVR